VDSIEAYWALADVFAEDVSSAGVGDDLTETIVFTGVWVAGP